MRAPVVSHPILTRFLALLLGVQVMPVVLAEPVPPGQSNPSATLPDRVPCPGAGDLVFEDIPRFWQAYDAAQGRDLSGRKAAFQSLYLDRASPGLNAFLRARIDSAEDLVATIDRHPRFYAQLRGQQPTIAALVPKLCAAQTGLRKLLPTAELPPVYFVIGRMNSGGTIDDSGLLIGTEMFGRLPTTPLDELGDWHRTVLGAPDQLPHIVAHELVHTQQRFEGTSAPTLLSAALREGTADYLAELSSGRHINHAAHAWAESRARELWQEFQAVMEGTDFAGWLYDTSQVPKRPADLGYWMGYRIARAYHRRAGDPTEALQSLLQSTDARSILEQSQVHAEFESATAGTRSSGD